MGDELKEKAKPKAKRRQVTKEEVPGSPKEINGWGPAGGLRKRDHVRWVRGGCS